MKKIICSKLKNSNNKKFKNLTTNNFDINFNKKDINDLNLFIFDLNFEENDIIKITNISENYDEENSKAEILLNKIKVIQNYYNKKNFYFKVCPEIFVLENLSYFNLCNMNDFKIETNFLKITFTETINLNEINFEMFKNQIIKPFITNDDIKFKCKVIIKNFDEKTKEEYKENLKLIENNNTLNESEEILEYSLI